MYFSSIRNKLMCLLIVLGGVPLLVVAAIAYYSAADALMVQTRQQLDNMAGKIVEQVDHFFDVTQKDILLLSRSPFVQLAFLQYEFNQRLDTAQRLLEEYARKNDYYNNIYLVDLTGKCILMVKRYPDAVVPDFSGEPWFSKTLEQGLYLSDLAFSGQTQLTGVMLGKTVFDFEDPDRKVGLLVFDIKQKSFVDYAASLRIGNKGRALIVHNSGRLIYHPEHPYGSILGVTEVVKGDERFKEHIHEMMAGHSGYGDYTYENAEKFIVYTPCKRMNWSIALSVFKSELMADIHRFRNQILTFAGIVFGLFLPVTLIFVNSLTRPIRQLIQGTEAVGRGELDQEIVIESKDELSALAEAFNKMARTLKTSMKEILDLKNFREDIFRNLSSGIITVDETGRITSVNKSARALLGDIGDDSEPSPEMERISALLGQAMASGKDMRDMEMELARPAGDVVHVEINTSKLTDMSGHLTGAIADIRDITRRKRMEELMVRVDKLASLGQLSAGMAHEIRNPLAGMKTSLQVLAERTGTEDEKMLIDGVVSEIDRLNKIVSDLLSFSRPSTPKAGAVDVTRVLKNTLNMLREKTSKNCIRVDCRWEKDTPKVMADKEQLYQIFLNLMLNSITAMENGGTLTLEAEVFKEAEGLEELAAGTSKAFDKNDQFIAVRFKDTGGGIAKENLSRVFNPFFSTSPTGTGLGLPIVHKLLERNKGYIFIDSVIDHGTQVLLLLPVAGPSEHGEKGDDPSQNSDC